MNTKWGKKLLDDGNFIVLALYINDKTHGKEYLRFQEANFFSQGAPWYGVINQWGQIVADSADMVEFGVVPQQSEEYRQQKFEEFLNKA
ncbi:MAG: hypothetical protein KDB07_12750, partial [Planctomycetes bacterium]|nr:hypothetical protein [Planctomycetota bacterium]